MANFRKILATLSTVAILSTLVVTTAVSAAAYTDVPSDSWAKSYIDNLADLGVFTGVGAFRPSDNMTRAEFVKSVVVAAGLEGSTAVTFPDIKDGDWFAPYVKTAVANGVISGYANGKFGPNDPLTREQAAKITVNAFALPAVTAASPSFSDVKSTDWSYGYVETLVSYGIVSGYGNGKFGPMDNVTREQVAKIVSLALSPEAPVVVDDTTDDTTVVTGGDLGVMLSDSTPASVTLPCKATAASVFAVDLTAGDTDVTFNGFTVHKTGVGALPSTMQAYLYNGNDRLTAGKSLNSSTNNIEFSNVGFKVAAGSTETVMMKMDVGTTCTAGEVNFELEADTSVKSTADAVAGDFPVVSETIGISATNAGTITIEKNGSVTNPKVGEVGATVAKFTLNASGEAAKVEQLGLYVTGSISSSDVTNLKLYVSGMTDPIAEVDGVNAKDLAQFVLDTPYEIEKGGTKSFYVTADMSPGRNGDTLSLYIDENTDVVAIGGTYGFGMAVTKTNYMSTTCTAASSTTCSFSTLEGGDITISSSGPTATDIAVNAKDVTLMNFTIVSVSDVTFKNFGVGLLASEGATDASGGLLSDATTATLTDVKIINTETGETLMGPVDSTSFLATSLTGAAIAEATDAAQAYYLFTDEFSMAEGETLKLALTTDVANTSTLSDMTVVSSLQVGGTYPQVRDVNNKTLTNSASLVPSSVVTGKTMTVKSPSLTMSLASTPASKTYVKGVKDIKFTGITFACGSASDCKITSLSLQGYIDDSGDASAFSATGTGADNSTLINTYVGSVALEDASGNEIAASKSVQSDGDVDYTNLAWTIKAGESVTAYVVGDLSSNSYANGDAENIAFGIASVADVTVEDKDGNALATASKTGTPNSSQGTYVTSSEGGSLTVAVDSSTAKENILVAGAADQEVSKFKFTSTDEAFVVKKLAVNNRQSAVTDSTTLGDYDDNVVSVKIAYTNSAGVAETKTGTLAGGTVEFSGMDFYVAADSDAKITVSASLNTRTGGADMGTYVDLNLAFEQFEAVSQGSGETYTGAKIDFDVDAASDLDFGTITWTDSTYDTNTVTAVGALGTTQAVTVDTGLLVFPVGTLLYVDDVVDGAYDSETESLFVTTASWSLTVPTVRVLGDNDVSLANNLNVYYALPGSGYLTGANRMHIYETKPTLSLASSSPSAGSKTASTTDTIMAITVTPDAAKDLVVRQGLAGDDETAGFGMDANGTDDFTVTTAAGNFVDGSGGFLWTTTADSITDNDCFVPDQLYTAGTTAGAFGANNYMSFWIKSNQADTPYNDFSVIVDATTPANGSCTPAAAGDELRLTTANSVWVNGTAMSSDTQIIGGGTADKWDLVTVYIGGTTNLATAVAGGFMVDATGGLTVTNGDLLYIDGIVFHNEMLLVDLAGNASFNVTPTDAVDCSLKDGGTTVAIGSAGVATTSSAKVLFVPTDETTGTDYSEMIINGTKTYSVVCDTSALITQSVNNDSLTPSIQTGSSNDGTVTRGYFWWSANFTTKTLVYWLGNVADKISGNTLNY